MEVLKEKSKLRKIKAIIFDFDGTLAVLNIDFSSMRERIFDLMRRYSVGEELIEERYLLEIIEEVYRILCRNNPFIAEKFYQEAHQILHEIELGAAEKGRLIPGTETTLKVLKREGEKSRDCYTEL